MGSWSIQVTINDEEDLATKQTFEVREYVLPRFEVNVETKRHVTQSDVVIRLLVSALYLHGKHVVGTVVVKSLVYDRNFSEILQRSVIKTASVELKKIVQFNMRQDL